ncbi:uncharacterized protein LOC130613957 [Hydractinia symbiolongicarpus]|uniref:uncharacterized protein LOC130613957 n=1 Tax=Hydractinia symbiolongicarpus TaxID=13093 RepID=UPI00254C7E9C|nr:uncharacterized protein LOC130613957 [Hydractinia symbiolongicarpus]
MEDAKKVQEKFLEDIVRSNEDTKSSKWEKISQNLEDSVGKYGFEIKFLSVSHCLLESLQGLYLDDKRGVLEKHLDKLENAFYCLSLYALNLCRKPTKKDYHFIKTYTGFYTCNVASVMKGSDVAILQSMGYAISSETENDDEFYLNHVNRYVCDLAFQLYLSQLYCRRLKMVTLAVNENGYSDDIALKVFDHLDKPEFDMEQIFDYCRMLTKDKEKGLGEDYPRSMEYIRRNDMPSLATEDVPDELLYGASPPRHSPHGYENNIPYHQNITYPPSYRGYSSPADNKDPATPFRYPGIYNQYDTSPSPETPSTNSVYSTQRDGSPV